MQSNMSLWSRFRPTFTNIILKASTKWGVRPTKHRHLVQPLTYNRRTVQSSIVVPGPLGQRCNAKCRALRRTMPPHSGLSSGSSSTSVTIAPVSSITMQVPRPAGPLCVRETRIMHKKLQTGGGAARRQGGWICGGGAARRGRGSAGTRHAGAVDGLGARDCAVWHAVLRKRSLTPTMSLCSFRRSPRSRRRRRSLRRPRRRLAHLQNLWGIAQRRSTSQRSGGLLS